MTDPKPGAAFRCAVCGLEPMWRIERWGDAVVSWACANHLSRECERLQRDWEVTRLSIYPWAKLRERAGASPGSGATNIITGTVTGTVVQVGHTGPITFG